jgi:hypothetical protein
VRIVHGTARIVYLIGDAEEDGPCPR